VAVITVTSLGDTTDAGDGVLTLREAAAQANSGDTIEFDASLSGGTVVLTQGRVTIDNGVTLDGNIGSASHQADITLDANGAEALRILNDATVRSLNITGGAANSSIRPVIDIEGGVLQYCEVYGNSATGYDIISMDGTSSNPAEILDCAIYNNTNSGAGDQIVSCSGTAFGTIANTSIVGNTSTGNLSSGGVAAYSGGTLTVINATITGNSGSANGAGGAYASSGGTVNLINSIVSGNSGVETRSSSGGSVNDVSGNVINGTDALIFANLTGTGGTLADNGGPVQTVALLNSVTNPALDIAAAAGGLTRGANGHPYFDVAGAGNDGSNFVDAGAFELCFAAGTLIATPNGERRVEDLRLGDEVVSASGRALPVKWIGRQTVMPRFRPVERLGLVRLSKGSLGSGLPQTDLTVTADHGMLVDGVICHAGALVNGTTITRVPLAEMGDSYTVYHIETDAHEIILANGAPAETFIDNVSRRVFDNFGEFEALYGDVPEMAELPYPRAMSARQVPERIRARLSPARVA
jgi:hypothetical protein